MDLGQLCSCETVGSGQLGPVADEERIVRVVLNPRHLTKKGELKPSLFPLSHLKSGLSLMRADHLDQGSMQVHADHIGSTMESQTAKGVVLCLAHEIRADTHPEHNGRSMCLIDDPIIASESEPENPAHALAVTSLVEEETELLRLQQFLAGTFGKLMDIQQVYA